MSARRQASTTSLSKYARANSPDFTNRSLDFCNAFWGLGDGGVDVLFARMRGASRTMEELKNFWKERALIEEQYAKRLASLAKFSLGRDEIGELRASLDTMKQETEKQAGFHLLVAQQIKNDLEGQTAAFLNKQQHHKKMFQGAIEKEFKTKQTQESYVNKAREKYEADCLKINSFTAQSTLMQGKELEKMNLRLERAQQTVQANERDFANFARALQDTVQKWEVDWKAFCDSCQDLEEERVEFMKDNMWAYANAVSTVCVADDESCEKLRLALEQLEPERDMENFVRDYGTGSAIPDPPAFVNYYGNPDAVPPSSQRPSTHPANFSRSSYRARQIPPESQQQEEEPETATNIAGVGMGGGRRADVATDPQLDRTQTRSQASTRGAHGPPVPANVAPPNGHTATPASSTGSRPQQPVNLYARPADPQADPIDPTAETMLKIGDAAYRVDLSRDPQARSGPLQSHNAGPVVSPVKVGQEDDPLARQMVQLQHAASQRGGSVRRSGQWKTQQSQQAPVQQQPPPSTSPVKRDPANKLSPPPGVSGNSRNDARRSSRDYRNSAELVVGAYPMQAPPSRSASPNPPYPAHMLPPSQSNAGPGANLPVQEVLADYGQSFPGERKSISRPNSRAGSTVGVPAPSPSQSQMQRPVSVGGHAGIGAQGRSTSPQPFVPLSRSASPAAQPAGANQVSHRNSYSSRVPPPSMNGAGQGQGHSVSPSNVRQNSISVPQPPGHHQRPTSPNSVGIALDPSGRVAVDSMADMYASRQQQSQYNQPPPQNQQQQSVQRRPSYMGPNGHAPQQAMPPQGQPPASYGAPPARNAASMYGQQYPAPPPTQQPPPPPAMYNAPPPSHYAPPPQQYPPQPTQVYQPQPHGYAGGVVSNLQRGASINGYYGAGGALVPSQQPQQRAPSPQPPVQQQQPPPTGQYTEDGRGVLFYVKALYDYQATIDEEFDFQAGDIIAVTATPEDGWWSGELLDEARRQPGRHVFPSNFVCLF
ncbi:hypothetical protein AcW1_003429 [Taiwanofungus camphoratus]|nr:hypothetical protein AcW1_003429 [Antrodia cinnamomea]KAI0943935.1 hypothetical protein AcV7_001886 [Antrodia cinnamomea]